MLALRHVDKVTWSIMENCICLMSEIWVLPARISSKCWVCWHLLIWFLCITLKVRILCNDCGATSEVQFHLIAHKCQKCKSYNTRQIWSGEVLMWFILYGKRALGNAHFATQIPLTPLGIWWALGRFLAHCMPQPRQITRIWNSSMKWMLFPPVFNLLPHHVADSQSCSA